MDRLGVHIRYVWSAHSLYFAETGKVTMARLHESSMPAQDHQKVRLGVG